MLSLGQGLVWPVQLPVGAMWDREGCSGDPAQVPGLGSGPGLAPVSVRTWGALSPEGSSQLPQQGAWWLPMCRAVPGVTPVPGVHSYRHEADGVCALGRGMPHVPWGSLEIGMAWLEVVGGRAV